MRMRKVRRLIVIGCVAFSTSLLAGFVLFAPIKSTRSVAQQPTINVQSHLVGNKAERIASTVSTVSTFDGEYLLKCLSSNATGIREIASQEKIKQTGSTTHKLSYHLFEYYRHNAHQQAVVLDLGGVCGLAYDSELGLAMSEMVPMDVARSLSLQNYEAVAASVGGVEELERLILEEGLVPSLSGTLPRFTPERIWALAQLGIHLPEDKYTVQEITPYEPGRFTR